MWVELIFHVIYNLKIGGCLTGLRPLLALPPSEVSDPEILCLLQQSGQSEWSIVLSQSTCTVMTAGVEYFSYRDHWLWKGDHVKHSRILIVTEVAKVVLWSRIWKMYQIINFSNSLFLGDCPKSYYLRA